MLAKPIQRTLASQLLELINGLPVVPRCTVLYTPTDFSDYPAEAAVEHGLTANAPVRSPAAVESLNRRSTRQTQGPLRPQLEN